MLSIFIELRCMCIGCMQMSSVHQDDIQISDCLLNVCLHSCRVVRSVINAYYSSQIPSAKSHPCCKAYCNLLSIQVSTEACDINHITSQFSMSKTVQLNRHACRLPIGQHGMLLCDETLTNWIPPVPVGLQSVVGTGVVQIQNPMFLEFWGSSKH